MSNLRECIFVCAQLLAVARNRLLDRLLGRPGGRLGCLRMGRWHDNVVVEMKKSLKIAVHSRRCTECPIAPRKLCWRRAPRSLVQKWSQLNRRSNRVFEHRCWPRRTGRSGTTALYRRNSVGTRAQPPNPIPAHSRWPKPTKVSRYIGL